MGRITVRDLAETARDADIVVAGAGDRRGRRSIAIATRSACRGDAARGHRDRAAPARARSPSIAVACSAGTADRDRLRRRPPHHRAHDRHPHPQPPREARRRARRSTRSMASVIAAASRIKYRLLLINVIVAVVPLVGISFARLHEQPAPRRARARHDPPGASSSAPSRPAPATLADARRATPRTRIRLLDDERRGARRLVRRPPGVRRGLHGRFGSRDAARAQPRRPRWTRSASPAPRNAERARYRPPLVALPDRSTGGVVYVTRSTHDVKLQLFALRTYARARARRGARRSPRCSRSCSPRRSPARSAG